MKPAFNVKSARMDGLAVQLHVGDLDAVRETLQNNIEKYIKFKKLPFILDISQIEDFEQLALDEIVKLFSFYGLNLVAVRHHKPEAAAYAARFRLCFVPPPKPENSEAQAPAAAKAEEGAPVQAAAEAAPPETAEAESEAKREDTLYNDNDAVKTVEMAKPAELVEIAADAEPTEAAAAETAEDTVSGVLDDDTETDAAAAGGEKVSLMAAKPTIVVSQPVRTGQQIYAEQADLIVLGVVSAGAEVIADGNIHIYAPLYGRALAGASGDDKARIFVQSMQAELVSIAGIYRVFEQQLPPHLHKKPVKIELQDERLAIGALYTE